MKSVLAPLIAVSLTAFFFSTSAAVSKQLLMVLSPFTAAFLRFGIASALFFPFARKEISLLNRNLLIRSLPVFLIGAGNIFFFYLGIPHTTANMSIILYTLVPLLTGLMTATILRERLSVRMLLGIAIGLLGTFIIFLQPLLGTTGSFGTLYGNLLVFSAVVSWSIYTIGSRKLTNFGIPVRSMTFLSLATNALVFFILSLCFGELIKLPTRMTFGILMQALYLGIFVSIATFILYQWAIKHGGPVIASLTMYLQPLFGVIVNFFLLGEQLTTEFALSSAVILTGVFLTSQRGPKKKSS